MIERTDPNDPNDYPGAVAATPTSSPMPTLKPTATPTILPTEAHEDPGFEAILAIAGLLAMTHPVLRGKRK